MVNGVRITLVGLCIGVATLTSGCGDAADSRSDAASAAQVDRGEAAIIENGCGSCHDIPGIAGADGKVGPPLSDMRRQVYIGGVLANTPENLERWLLDPQAVDPRTVMPDVGLERRDAEAIRAYLYARTDTR